MLGAAAPGDITVLGTVALDGDGRAARYRLRGPVHAGEHLTAGGGPSAEGHRAAHGRPPGDPACHAVVAFARSPRVRSRSDRWGGKGTW